MHIVFALDSQRNIYITNNDHVSKYNSNRIEINASLISGLNNPYGIALDNEENIYVVNTYGGNIGKYNSNGILIYQKYLKNINNLLNYYLNFIRIHRRFFYRRT